LLLAAQQALEEAGSLADALAAGFNRNSVPFASSHGIAMFTE
jgi:hypothetical protein